MTTTSATATLTIANSVTNLPQAWVQELTLQLRQDEIVLNAVETDLDAKQRLLFQDVHLRRLKNNFFSLDFSFNFNFSTFCGHPELDSGSIGAVRR